MKIKTMQKAYKIGIRIIQVTFIYWLVYTVIFQFIDGWHYKAISRVEEIMDIIASILFNIGLWVYLSSVFILLDKIMNGLKKK